ncbi:GntR family transcriptional regulator [Mangrovicoccus sp. HB161399]|uniref:GntR family transcriptional regulator n=1 Tax=Mangrovicoccus sp. HB161399 TaxID=2720392 RepID=UPI001553923E|nr:GntR family transcriptional regulator [Mangrovicoccus sp. HB161399]
MGRTSIWGGIADDLKADILGGRYRPGEKLPTESELARHFGVNRHTLRRAIAALAEDGLVRSQRGSGIFVRPRPVTLPIAGGLDLPDHLARAGHEPERRLDRLFRRPASTAEAALLKCAPEQELLCYETVLLIGGNPFCLCRDLFPDGRLPGIADALEGRVSMRQVLESCGVRAPVMRSVRVCIDPPDPAMAIRLGQVEPGPILHTMALIENASGEAVDLKEYWVDAASACLSFTRAELDSAPDAPLLSACCR